MQSMVWHRGRGDLLLDALNERSVYKPVLHRIDGDADHLGSGLLLINRPDLPLAIVPAMRADAMRSLRLVALRAQAGGGGPQRIVRAALGGTRLRMSSFWIRHCFP